MHDQTIGDSWAEYAEEFVPSRLSHLFFFDGEKIEALADLGNAADVLRTGIHSLLGLDLVDRLLGGGVVISGEITLAVADVDLVRVSLRALIASVDAIAETAG